MRRHVARYALVIATLFLSGAGPDSAPSEFFESKIRPLLVEKCLSCHGPEKQKAGLRLDSRSAVLEGGDAGPVIVEGDLAGSALIAAIDYEGETRMPPKGKLQPTEIAALRRWVELGAPWPDASRSASGSNGSASQGTADPRAHWAFQKVRRPEVPRVADAAWTSGPIDHFILNRLESQGLRPVPLADRRTLIRRATFDLIGLPPTPEEIEAFLADESEDAWARVVDRLLGSPHYGERWGRHWLDVARYGEDQAHTFQAKLYPNGYRYRDWVVNSLNQDKPFDRFVLEQIAGDQLDGPELDGRRAALGFFALGPVYYGNAIADERDDRVDTLSRGFLALTVACARCHDHKFDPIPTEDYYALAGVFASTVFKEYPAVPPEQVAAFDQAQAAIQATTEELDTFVRLANFRIFYQVPTPKKNQEERSLPASVKPAYRALKDRLALLKKNSPPTYPVIHSLADSKKPANLRVAIRGNADNPGDEAPRAFLSVLAEGNPRPFGKGSGRLELARAIANPENPLTARVLVNRVWEHHFGRGLVGTPSNFGTLGEAPTHPELLDHLASRFIDGGWSIKALHRAIMLSSTYRLGSRVDPRNEEVDPDNRLIWRMPRRRLEVEAWRDAMLAVSGELDGAVGGPSQELSASDNLRRTLYGSVSRHNLDNLLRLFDFPDPNITCDRRPVTSVPLQQLFVLNSEFMVKRAKALAKRLGANPSLSDAERIENAFSLLFGREATAEERSWGEEFLAGASAPGATLSAWEQYAQVLLGSNEFTYID